MNPRSKRLMAIGHYLALALHLTGWTAVTLLTTAGLFVLLFWAVGNLTVGGFFAQVGMLGTHYAEAPAYLQNRFLGYLETIGLIAFALVSFFRIGTFFAIFEKDA